MNEATPQSDRAAKASERLGQVIASMPASNELAVLAEILIEQMKVVDAQHHVVMLMESTDQKLTATVQALRDENAQLTKLIAQARHAFVGEVAAKAADHARRAAAAEVAEELARLRLALESRDRAITSHAPATAVRSVLCSIGAQVGIAFCAGAALVWVVGHLSHALGI
jgi:formate dehydrogenase maturation protein FdhE